MISLRSTGQEPTLLISPSASAFRTSAPHQKLSPSRSAPRTERGVLTGDTLVRRSRRSSAGYFLNDLDVKWVDTAQDLWGNTNPQEKPHQMETRIPPQQVNLRPKEQLFHRRMPLRHPHRPGVDRDQVINQWGDHLLSVILIIFTCSTVLLDIIETFWSVKHCWYSSSSPLHSCPPTFASPDASLRV